MWVPPQNQLRFLKNENKIYAQKMKTNKIIQCSTVYGEYKYKESRRQ